MTADELHEWMLANGWTHYRSTATHRCYGLSRTLGGPDCDCNDKPPNLHATIWKDTQINGRHYDGGAEFEVFGERGGRWLKAKVYSMSRSEVPGALPRVEAAAAAIWAGFCAAMDDRG